MEIINKNIHSHPERKYYLDIDVLSAAKERISLAFDKFKRLYISFSGGKDSGVMMHLVMEEAKKRNIKIGVVFLDWECQFSYTINFIKQMFDVYKDYIEPYWISIPIRTTNGSSCFEPEWICWEEGKENIWVRSQKPEMSIKDKSFFPFYVQNMTFEEFMPLFGEWYSQGELCGNFLGIRAEESLSRRIAIMVDRRKALDGSQYKNKIKTDAEGNIQTKHSFTIYPIYDWTVEDIWTYCGKYCKSYNKLYDIMYKAGMSIHQQRVDEPFGETQRISLWLYQVIEPKLWAKMCLRVSGANAGALYSGEKGNILGNAKISLPKGHTWGSFANFLMKTMPEKTSKHYTYKINTYVDFYNKTISKIQDFLNLTLEKFPDKISEYKTNESVTVKFISSEIQKIVNDKKMIIERKLVSAVVNEILSIGSIKYIYDEHENKNMPSWKHICKTLLLNDYWCMKIGFSPTKTAAYEKYLAMMEKRIERKRKEKEQIKKS